MILSEHALKRNGNKLVKEFLSTLESVTSWLDIVNEVGFQSWTRVRGTVTQPVGYSFTCHVKLS